LGRLFAWPRFVKAYEQFRLVGMMLARALTKLTPEFEKYRGLHREALSHREAVMRIGAAIGFSIVSAAIGLGQSSMSQAQDVAPKTVYLVIYRPGPAWLPGKPVSEQPLKEHGRYILSLYEKGVLKYAGPFVDDTGGAVMLDVESEAQAREIVANDPAVQKQQFLHEIRPWRLEPWEMHLQKKKQREKGKTG
jgi:uncharacterized protein YciI